MPSVQNRIIAQVTHYLSGKFSAPLNVGHVEIDFFNRLVLEKVYIEDLKGDTLLYMNSLKMGLSLFAPLQKQVNIEGIDVEKTIIHLHRGPDSTFNFQYLLDAFGSEAIDNTTPKENNNAPWKLDLNRIKLKDIRLHWLDSLTKTEVSAYLGNLDTRVDGLSLPEQSLEIRSFLVKNANIDYDSWAIMDTTASNKNSAPLVFPYLGWNIETGNLTLENINFSFDDRTKGRALPHTFDPAHLSYKDAHLVLKDVQWTPEVLRGNMERLSFQERNGFEISELGFDFEATNNDIRMEGLSLRTSRSRLAPSEVSLRFDDFNALSNVMEQVFMNIRLDAATISRKDIEYWTGPVSALENLGNQPLEVSVALSGKPSDLNFQKFQMKVGNDNQLNFDGNVKGLPALEELSFKLNLDKLTTSYRSLKALNINVPDGLEPFGQMELNAKLEGSIDQLNAETIHFKTTQNTVFKGAVLANNLTDLDRLDYKVQIQEFRTLPQDWHGFFNDSIPSVLSAFEALNYQATIEGTVRDISLNGQLKTNAGVAQQNLLIQFTPEYKNARYNGQVQLNDLALNRILDNPDLGNASFNFNVQGQGLSLDSLNTHLKATIQEFQFRAYDYRNIDIEGQLNAKQFEGKFAVDDDNLRLKFQGRANFKDSLPEVQANIILDTANLNKLQLYPTPLHLHSKLAFDLKGSEVDNLLGTAHISDFKIADENRQYAMDSISFFSKTLDNSQKEMRLESDILNARLLGEFEINTLNQFMLHFVNELFPIEELLDTTMQKKLVLEEKKQEFRLQLNLSKPTRLTKFFIPQLEQLDTAFLDLKLNSQKRNILLDALIPSASVSGVILDSIRLASEGKPELIQNSLNIKSIRSEEELLLAHLNFHANLFRDSLLLDLAAGSSLEQRNDRLAWKAIVKNEKDKYIGKLLSPIIINNEDWSVPASNKIVFDGERFFIDNLKLNREGQLFFAQSDVKNKNSQFIPLKIGFKDFKIGEIVELAGQDADLVGGGLNGVFTLSMPEADLLYRVDLDVSDLVLNDEPLGNLSLNAAPDLKSMLLNIDIGLQGQNNNLQLTGSYGLESNNLDFELDVPSLRFSLIDRFSLGYLKDTKGQLVAKLNIGGKADAPEVKGFMRLENTEVFVDYLKARFSFSEHTIQFRESQIDIGRLQLKDSEGRPAEFSGSINHDHFNDIQLDLQFDAPSLLVLNSQPNDSELFYGKIILSANVKVNGALEKPKVTINTRSLSGTHLTVIPLAGESEIVEEKFIIFGDPEQVEQSNTESSQRTYVTNATGLDLSLKLELTPDAKLITIIDPQTGDRLEMKGNANLLVEMEPNGELRTTGPISLTEGSYFLNYEGLVKRKFTIQKGSDIYLPGDPMEAQFDITAIYTARASVYDLISNQINLNPTEEAAARRRQNIDVLMNMKGTLAQPEISFSIRIGDNFSGNLADAVSQRLNQLEEQKTELNKQVFGLLLFNSFISTNSGSSMANAGENLALKSVSSFLTQQLNRLAGQYTKGVDLNIGLDSYNTATDENVTELQVGVSKQLLNERLSVQVGGNLGVNAPAGSQSTTTTTIAGSFLLEYKLTEDGRYRVRVFRRPDTDIFSEGIRSGAGIIFKKSFGDVLSDTLKNAFPEND